jgi:energy-coupling factor transporter ATP-binding protein EcfA2
MNIEQQFKIPIMYNSECNTIDDNVCDNLELEELYKHIFGNTYNNFNIKQFCRYYTTDTLFLKDQQIFMKQCQEICNYQNIDSFYDTWKNNMLNQSIRETYYYIDWDHLDFVNYKSNVMLALSLYNLASPIITLATPLICILLPFILLKFILKLDFTFETYKEMFFSFASRNIFGRIIQNLYQPENLHQQISGFSMLLFYFMSLYQNTLVCVKFYKNMRFMKTYIQQTRTLFSNTVSYLESLIKYSEDKKSFSSFTQYCIHKKKELNTLLVSFKNINDNSFQILNLSQIGQYMALFYKFRNDTNIQKLYQYSFEVHDYIESLLSLRTHIELNRLNTCTYTHKYSKLKSSYYLAHITTKVVKNDVRIKHNYIITGPNASGKTTLIKSVMINLLLSQQIGFGCYGNHTQINPYHYFYSYLNIPDTSDRDSLFQAEARRCLDIIHSLHNSKNKRSFLIFDELYSGTNPTEATLSALSFMNYISKFHGNFMITTHYYNICTSKHLSNKIKNIHMLTELKDNEFIYRYIVSNGPSYKQGGIKILKDMGYPIEIIKQINIIENETR